MLQGGSQTHTRQNPAGNRFGLECQEERDYYPWWNPSPFHDIAIITPDVQWCKDNIAPQSQNVQPKYQCIVSGVTPSTSIDTWLPSQNGAAANLNETSCKALSGYTWSGFSWKGEQPECVQSYYTRDNYLGNIDGSKRGGKMAGYDWVLPTVEELNSKHFCYQYKYDISDTGDSDADYSTSTDCVRMMLRLRYNMSTMDYDPYNTDYRMNQDDNQGVISPILQNPTVDVGTFAQGLRLAINTAQTGRTFQDNSHTFLVCKRPSDASWQSAKVYNVNVRGKRGNIVQTFPAIEYDFEPQIVFIQPGECIHFQWEGSNTHNNGNPGGDGQTGDDGEGREGSDRSNLVQSQAMDENYPTAYDKASTTFFDNVQCHHPLFPQTKVSSQDCQLTLGSAGFYRSVQDAKSLIAGSSGSSGVLNYLLNNVSGAFRQGIIACINEDVLTSTSKTTEFSFISTRNNNFSNRSQKLKVVITTTPEDGSLW
ncbi:hypothetical protein RFI_27806 [Reticulomyxa filosa]|uniref:Uncharacterized protein n=1 Tax=Reticulomyxa filosa TaxID=46433 RepID=X6M6F5_RETFI|nr:hypothetical protein RFI_27806 [Reticulomyxa filosa]|eukprot:ETO09573.1 hypothetical protein RFI_27806 [Reticulomyxa filosa]